MTQDIVWMDMNGQPERTTGDLVASRDPAAIGGMFDRIASSYDRMNRIMTAGQDLRWRRAAADMAGVTVGDVVLDVAAGTGDMAIEMGKRVLPGGSVLGIDIAPDMLVVARGKSTDTAIRYEVGGVDAITYKEQFDAVTVAFGFRNFPDREHAVRMMAQALKPGGRLVVLELVPSHGLLKRLIDAYEQRVIPLIGRTISRDREAYRYLPQSVAASTTVSQIEQLFAGAGLVGVESKEMNFGTVAVVRGQKVGG